MNLQIGIVAVGFARQQGFEFALRRLFAQPRDRGFRFADDRLIALGLPHFNQADRVVKLVLDFAIGVDAPLETGLLPHQPLGALRFAPQIGRFGECP